MGFNNIAKSSISLGVVFENNDLEIIRLVNSLLNLDLSFLNEIIAVDNKSNNEDLLNYFKQIKGVHLILIRNVRKMSLAYNRNQIFRNSHSDVVVFLDSDVEFIDRDFLSKSAYVMINSDADIACPIILSPNGTVQSFGLKKIIGLSRMFLSSIIT